jgi:hypothetical protein
MTRMRAALGAGGVMVSEYEQLSGQLYASGQFCARGRCNALKML